MRNKLVLISLLLAVAVTATAQTQEKYYSEHFKDNIFVSVGFGAQACVNPGNFDYGFSHAITPVITLSVGKYFTPIWGVRLQGAGAWTTLYTKYHIIDANGVRGEAQYSKFKNKKYATIHADALFNLSNAINYRPDRLFNVSLFMGPGLTFAKNPTSRTWDNSLNTFVYSKRSVKALVNGSVGVMGSFNVCNYLDINLEARGEVSPSVFGAYSSAITDGAVSLTAGISYYFGGKKFVSCSSKQDNSALDAYINDLAKAKSDLADALNALKNQKPEIKEVVKEVVKEVEVAGPLAVFFKLGNSKLDDYNMVNIRLVAKTIKENPDKKYKVAGYADKYTGSAKLNQKLSQKRAQAVYDALVKEGVNKDQLEMVAEGGTDNMFGKALLNRVVILEKAE